MPLMVICDVNVVVAGMRPDHQHHTRALAAVATNRSAGVELGYPDFVLTSVIRLVTNARIFTEPNNPAEAVTSMNSLLTRPGRLLAGSLSTWQTFARLVRELKLRGNDIPDAALAAVCIENRAELLTFDRGFARFPGLRWRILD